MRILSFVWMARAVIVMTVLTPIFAQDAVPKTERPPAQQRWVKANPAGAEFCGVWKGRFPRTHEIRFTVTPYEEGGPDQFRVLYECRQYPNDDPHAGVFIATLDGDGLALGKMTLFLIDQEPGRAMVYGNFHLNPMVADLVRSEVKK